MRTIVPSRAPELPMPAAPEVSDGDLSRALLHAKGASHVQSKFEAFCELDPCEHEVIEASTLGTRTVAQREFVYRRDQATTVPLVVLGGALREFFIDIEGRVQTVAIRLPGDVIGMEALWSERHAFDLDALVPSRVAAAPFLADDDASTARLRAIGRRVWLAEEAMLKDRIRLLGRAQADERLLHLFLELRARQSLLLPQIGGRAWVPFSQVEMANVTGLTNVYVSKTLSRLRERGTIAVDADIVTLRDPEGTAQDVDFHDRLAWVRRDKRLL